MTLKEFIENSECIDCGVVAAGQEVEFAFVWDDGIILTEDCEEEFAELLNSKCIELPNGNIVVQNKNYKEANRFFASLAGFCPSKEYDRLFIEREYHGEY